MENIKLETELRLENIFLSLDNVTINKLNELSNTPEIDYSEKELIRKYIYLVGTLEKAPSLETLKVEFPSLYFDNATKIPVSELDDYIRLYITSRKNIAVSKNLMELAAIIKTNGVTEAVISKLNNIAKADTVSIAHNDISNEIVELYELRPDKLGIKTGVKQVDDTIGGLVPGALTTIGGYAGSFKTTWGINISYGALKEGYNILYLSLEVPKLDVYFDIISRHSFNSEFSTKIEHKKLKEKRLNEKEFNEFKDKVYPDFQKIKGKFYVVDETELEAYSFFALEAKFREIEKLSIEETGKGIDLVVIDHAQLLKLEQGLSSAGKETGILNAYVSFFRKQTIDWCKSGRQVATLILSQISREGYKEACRNDGAYRITSLAESNELERASSVVLTCFTSESLKQVNAAKVQVLKNRNGEVWSEPMEVFVDPKYYVFGDSDSNIQTSQNFDVSTLGSLFEMDDSSLDSLVTSMDDLSTLNIDV